MHQGIQHLKAVSLEDHVPLRKVFVSNDKSRILRFTHMGGHTDSSMGAANLGWFPCDGNHDAAEGHRPPYRPRLNPAPRTWSTTGDNRPRGFRRHSEGQCFAALKEM